MKRIGRGKTAEVFEFGNSKACKLFDESYSYATIYREYANTKVLEQLGLPVVTCYEIIHLQNRKGIIYDRIDGKSLLAYCIENGDSEFLLQQLVTIHNKILACKTKKVMNYKDLLMGLVQSSQSPDAELIQRIAQLPEDDHLCHGDFHPQNLMIDEAGKTHIIDCMNVCYGPKLYDIARTYYLIRQCEIVSIGIDTEIIKEEQRQLADGYLEKLKVTYEELEPFMLIIEACRKYE